jgi:hypothetical protein
MWERNINNFLFLKEQGIYLWKKNSAAEKPVIV